MASLDQCKAACKSFIQSALPFVAKAEPDLSTLPKFRAAPSDKPNRIKFIEETQPNWWQLPTEVKQHLLTTPEAKAFGDHLQNTSLFSAVVHKTVMLPQGVGVSYSSTDDIAREFLTSYLFAGGIEQLKTTAFEEVWTDCVSFFDQKVKELEYFVYAPIVGMSGVANKLTLDNKLEIRRVYPKERARLASLNPALAGVSVEHRFTLWPSYFLVQKCISPKNFEDTGSINRIDGWLRDNQLASLNEEVALFRSLLDLQISIPGYALIRDSYPRDVLGGRSAQELPWRPTFFDFFRNEPLKRNQVQSYANRRKKFLQMQDTRGWIAGSMRRFAVAWTNPFPADALADVVAALEGLLVRENTEVSYKLRVRTANLLAKSPLEMQEITTNVRDAYSYRSRVAHGEFVFDSIHDWEAAKRMGRAKGKRGNPFHDVNEVHRLKFATARYYQQALRFMIDNNQPKIDWNARGL